MLQNTPIQYCKCNILVLNKIKINNGVKIFKKKK